MLRSDVDLTNSTVSDGLLKKVKNMYVCTFEKEKIDPEVKTGVTEKKSCVVCDTGVCPQLETDLTLQRVTDFSLSWRGDQSGLVFQRHERLEVAEETGECGLSVLKGMVDTIFTQLVFHCQQTSADFVVIKQVEKRENPLTQ